MKIKKITSAGLEPVYNMTVDRFHNYLIDGGTILKNCDSLRYFAVMRTLKPEDVVDTPEYEDNAVEDYDDYMTGGEVDDSYLSY